MNPEAGSLVFWNGYVELIFVLDPTIFLQSIVESSSVSRMSDDSIVTEGIILGKNFPATVHSWSRIYKSATGQINQQSILDGEVAPASDSSE